MASCAIADNSPEPAARPVRLLFEISEGVAPFERLTSILASADGRLFVADGQARTIHVFDSLGMPVRSLGRKGRGPGELGDAYSLAWIGDTLAVLDPGNARIGLFQDGETWAGAWRYLPITGSSRDIRLQRSAPDEFYAFVVLPTAGGSKRGWVRFRSTGAGDTVPQPPRDARDEARAGVTCFAPDGSIAAFAAPFAPRSIFAFGPGGIVATAWSGEYRIALHQPNGGDVPVIARPAFPVAVTSAEWDSVVGPFRRYRERQPAARCDPDEIPRLRVKPVLGDMFWDARGRLAVEAITASGPVLDLYNSRGVWLDRFQLPEHDERVEPALVGGRLYVVVVDSVGLQVVREFAIEPDAIREP